MKRKIGTAGRHGADVSGSYREFLRKPSRAELLELVTAMGGLLLVLAMPWNALVEIMALVFALEILSVPTALIALVMLLAVAAVAIGYGFALENSMRRAGKPHDLYKHRRPHYRRRPQ